VKNLSFNLVSRYGQLKEIVMATTKSFGNVTQAVWDCVKSTSAKEHGTTYEPPDSNQGTATTQTIVGKIALGFNFDPAQETVTYTIIQKPGIVSEQEIWDGIQDSINGCSQGGPTL
jgi:hypothetical protein